MLANAWRQFTKGAGMEFDATAFFGQPRSNRYAALIEDGEVKEVWQEKAVTDVDVSRSDNVLKALG